MLTRGASRWLVAVLLEDINNFLFKSFRFEKVIENAKLEKTCDLDNN